MRGILSRQPSCTETTARHVPVVQGRVFCVLTGGTPAYGARDTVAFLERETRRRLKALVSVYKDEYKFSSTNSDKLSRSVVILTALNRPYFSLLCADLVVR